MLFHTNTGKDRIVVKSFCEVKDSCQFHDDCLPVQRTSWTHLSGEQLLKRLPWSFIVYVEVSVYSLTWSWKKIQAKKQCLPQGDRKYILPFISQTKVFPHKQPNKINKLFV